MCMRTQCVDVDKWIVCVAKLCPSCELDLWQRQMLSLCLLVVIAFQFKCVHVDAVIIISFALLKHLGLLVAEQNSRVQESPKSPIELSEIRIAFHTHTPIRIKVPNKNPNFRVVKESSSDASNNKSRNKRTILTRHRAKSSCHKDVTCTITSIKFAIRCVSFNRLMLDHVI